MIFKLAEAVEKRWRRLNGHNQLPKIILGIKFTDGIEVVRSQAQPLPPDPFRHQDLAIALCQVGVVSLGSSGLFSSSSEGLGGSGSQPGVPVPLLRSLTMSFIN